MAAAAQVPQAGAPHIPVLLDEVLAALGDISGQTVIDGTYGAGGYSRAFLDAGARVIGIDRDPNVTGDAPGLTLVEGVFGDLDVIAEDHADRVDAVVLDIGVSSMQLDQAERGFSFLRDGPLDMRMSGQGLSAADIVNRADEATLADIIYHYGEDRAARRLAKAIVRARTDGPIETTLQLADVIASHLPRARPGQAHPATRTFQALRIAVNDELGELVRALVAAERILPEGGRLVVVTFHSLEDRIVKRFFQIGAATSGGGSRYGPEKRLPPARWDKPRKQVEAGKAELQINPRARSARLRSAVRTAAPQVAIDARNIGLPNAAGLDTIGERR